MDNTKRDLDLINEKLTKLKNLNIDNFKEGTYVDSLDEAKTWCIAEIIVRNGDLVKVHYEGWSSKFDEVIHIKKNNKINHFRRYSKGYSGQKRYAFRDYSFNPNDFETIKNMIANLKENDFQGYEPLMLTQIVRGKIFTYLDIFMTTNSKESDEFIERLVELIYDFIDLAIQYYNFLKKNIHLTDILDKNTDLALIDWKMSVLACYFEINLCLKRIFGRDERVNSFYKNYSDYMIKQPGRAKLNILNDNANMNTVNKDVVYSKSAGNFINYFAEKQGFSILREIILYKSNENTYLPLNMLESMINIFSYVEPLVDFKVILNIEINQIREIVGNRIANLTEYEIKETNKKTIQSICKSVQQIFFYDQSNSEKCYEEFILLYHLKCLSSKNLEKRIKGITSLNNIIDYIEKKDIGDLKLDENDYEETIVSMSKKTLLNNLKEKNILETFLGENIHEEILKRASPIFKLFANYKQLNKQIYDVLWKNCFDKHETIARQIENIICDLSNYLTEQDKLYIFNKIKEVCIEKYDLQFITFIKNYSTNCIGTIVNLSDDLNIDLYGIPLLWRYLQDDKQNKEKVILKNASILDTCCQYLHDLLTERNIPINFTETYIGYCLDNIKKSESVVQSINLLYKCIETFSKRNEGSTDKGDNFLVKLDKSENLIRLIINDLSRYMNNNAKVRHYLSSSDNTDALLNNIFEGFYHHKHNLESRLNLIYLIVTEIKASQIDPDYSFLLDLWDILILGAINDSESMIFFRMLNRKQDNSEIEDKFSSQIADFLFNKILTNENKCNFSKINNVGCILFHKYFKIINKRLKRVTLIKNNIVRVNNCDNILGFETVWNILICTTNEIILNRFAKLLVELCIYFKLINEDFCVPYWKNYYFTKMFDKIKECRSSKNDNGIRAILILIKLLIKTINEGGEIPAMDEISYAHNGIEYTFINKEKNSKRDFKVSFNESVFSVRQKIAFFFDICLDRLSFRVNNKKVIDYTDDFKIFKDLVSQNHLIEIIERDNPISFLKENPRTMIIDNNEVFHLLFDLLHNSNSSYVDVAWDLINLLPKNKILEDKIHTLGSSLKDNIEWEILLDSKSIYKMLYTISIIKSFVTDEKTEIKSKMIDENIIDSGTENSKINTVWLENFKKNGGVSHLIKLIHQFDLCHFDNMLGFGCLNDIINILLLFNSNEIDTILFNKLLIKLCEIQLMIIKTSANRDNEKKLIDLQTQFSRQRQKILIQRLSSNNEDNINYRNDNDDYHPLILENWNVENSTIININKFITNYFKIEEIIDLLMKENVTVELLQFGLIIPKNSKIKYSIFNFFKEIISSDNQILTNKFMKFIFSLLFQFETINLSIKNNVNSDAYFKILIYFLTSMDLADISILDKNVKSSVNIFNLIDFMIKFLKDYEGGECDNVLIGFLQIIRILVLENERLLEYLIKKHNLLDILLDICLFSKCRYSLNSNVPKCLSQASKEAAFKLLSAISYNYPEIINKIIERLYSFHKLGYWRTKRYFDWNISQLSEEKSPTGFVGLKNLGCICYMNSLMQQLFMIPSLREGVLISDNEKIENQQESILYNLKKIFSFLKASDRQFHNPKDFCSNFKNWEMQPINIYEQMDVDEFCNLLIDRLETCLKGSSSENIFKDHFLGKLSNELICKGCPHYSERQESYFNLSLQVKNKKSLQESLEAFVQGEMLEGENAYFCEKCDKKVNTMRRVCIKELPKHLIIVLKRFEFDYDTMQKIKVNDYCEFPRELDMEPYTQEYLSYIEKLKVKKKDSNEDEVIIEKNITSENYYKYNLNGVIIHTGFADSGHYYSIIKDSNNCNWYEFNDTHVRYYDINDLPNEAFGGTNKQGKAQGANEKLTNAYLLFYKRKEDDTDGKQIIIDEEIDTKHKNIQNDILELIKQDNYQYWVSKILFSNVYFEFLQDILINYNGEISNKYFKTAQLKNLSQHIIKRKYVKNRNIPENAFCLVKYQVSNLENFEANQKIMSSINFENFLFRFSALSFFTTIIRSRDKNMITNFMDIMKGYINKSHVNSDWLLEEFSHMDTLIEFLIECPIIEIKRLSTGLIYSALLKSYDYYNSNNLLNKNYQDLPIINFTNTVISLIGKANKHYTKDFSYIFFTIYRISTLGQNMALYLHSNKLALYIILFIYNKNNALHSTMQNLIIEGINKEEYTLDNILTPPLKDSKHIELFQKTIINTEKPTPFEEFSEKKIIEKLEKSPSFYDSYLFMTLCEIILSCPVLTSEEKYLIKFDNKNTLKILMNEIKSKQCIAMLCKLYSFACKDNLELTNFVFNEIITVIEMFDYMDLEFYMKLFLSFLLIKDTLTHKRVSICSDKFFQVIQANRKFYKFTEYCIDFILKSIIDNYDFFKIFIPSWKKYFEFIIDWLNENSYPPIYYPSKTTILFKNRVFNYQNTEYKQPQVQAFITRYSLQANDKVQKLKEIMNQNDSIISNLARKNIFNDLDLTDFKFSVNDKVCIDNNIGKVVCVLDEMIRVEFVDVNQNKKSIDWFESNMSNLCISELYEINVNSNDKIRRVMKIRIY